MTDDLRAQSDVLELREPGATLRAHAWPALFVLSLALATRIYQLGEESLWIDEAISFGRMRLPLPELLADTIKRKHLPTYFLLLKGWAQLGDSEWMLRFPSAVLGALSALLAYGCGAVLHGRAAGLAAGVLVAIASKQVQYGQEARMYALFTAATTLALFGLCWLGREPRLAGAPLRRSQHGDRAFTRSAAGAWLCVFSGSVLALYSHNTAPFFVVALNLAAAVLWLGMPQVRAAFARNWLVCMACAFVAWAPWLPTLLGQTQDVRENWHGREPNAEWAGGVLRDLYLFGDGSGASGTLAIALVALGVWALYDRKRLFASVLVFATSGTLCAYAASQVVAMFYRRLLIWTGPPWFVLIGVGLAALPRPARAIVAAAGLAMLLPSLGEYYAHHGKPGWRPLIAKLSEMSDEKSLILSARAERFLTYYYERHTDPLPRRAYVKPRGAEVERYLINADEFYLIGQTQEVEYKQLHARIARSRKYKEVWKKRDQNAILIKYRARSSSTPKR